MRNPKVFGRIGRRGTGVGAGFTLIELLIVIVIVAILSAIAFPSYQNYMQKSRRAQAKADLSEISQLLERYYTENRSYAGFTLPFTNSPRMAGSTIAYTITDPIPDLGPKTYTLTIVPTGPQIHDPCGTLKLDQTGAKSPPNSANPNGGCW